MVVGLTALHLYPIVYFNVSAALGSLNVEMEEAARGLGCRGLRLFWRVTLPSILPSVFAATSITKSASRKPVPSGVPDARKKFISQQSVATDEGEGHHSLPTNSQPNSLSMTL